MLNNACGLARAFLEEPGGGHDLILADWLEDADDARAQLLRLPGQLLGLPRRAGPEPPQPDKDIYQFPWPRRLSKVTPPADAVLRDRGSPWQGYDRLGRILAVALIRDWALWPFADRDEFQRIESVLAAALLFSCHLVGDCTRREFAISKLGDAEPPTRRRLRLAARHCCSGTFGAYLEVGHLLAAASRQEPYSAEFACERIFDLTDHFFALSPWRAFLASKRARPLLS